MQWLTPIETEVHLDRVSEPIVYLFAFQSACPGCHSHGFPTLRSVRDMMTSDGTADQVAFVAVQTVFEDVDENTPEAAKASMTRYGLGDITLGHTMGDPPALMNDYRTGGTPWTVIVGPPPLRKVLFNDFHVDARSAVTAMQTLIDRQ